MKEDTTHISPITNKKDVIVEDVNGAESRICMASGYMTNSTFKISNSKIIKEYEEKMPKLIVDNRFEDKELKQYWYLTSVQFRTGMIYPQPCRHDTYEWVWTPVVELDQIEKLQYPVPGKLNEYYESRLATETSEIYKKNNFSAACRRAGAVITADNE